MSVFTANEIAYLNRGLEGLLARLATVGPGGTLHVTPLGVVYDPETDAVVVSSFAGRNMAASKKFRDARRNPNVAVAVDDLASVDPWRPRGIEIRGHAETFLEGGEELGRRLGDPLPWDPAWIRIRPRRIVSWGIDTDPDTDELAARNVDETVTTSTTPERR